MLSILNSLAEYFHMTNEALPMYDDDHDSASKNTFMLYLKAIKQEFTYHMKKS
jgi:hypothetical protein